MGQGITATILNISIYIPYDDLKNEFEAIESEANHDRNRKHSQKIC